ncbi:MAG: permease, partial [Proteobacteria bacterium]|nr:permease [Pseudomonadota bacterium]
MSDGALDFAGRMRSRMKRFDRVVLASVLLLIGVAVFAPGQWGDSVTFAARALLYITPFILFSVMAAGAAKATGIDRQIARVISSNATTMIIVAAF